MAKNTTPPPAPDGPSGNPQLDAYLVTRLTTEQQEAVRQSYDDGDPAATEAIVMKAINDGKR
jgi:hypothetical protein